VRGVAHRWLLGLQGSECPAGDHRKTGIWNSTPTATETPPPPPAAWIASSGSDLVEDDDVHALDVVLERQKLLLQLLHAHLVG